MRAGRTRREPVTPAPAPADGMPVPLDGRHTAINVTAAFVASVFAATIFLSFGVLIDVLKSKFGISTSTASLIYLAQWLAFGAMSLVLGFLSDTVGIISSIRAGFLLIVLGLAVALVSTTYVGYVVGFGLMTGAGLAAAYGPLHNLVLSNTRESWKGGALGIIMAAQGIGPFFLVPVVAALVDASGVRAVVGVLLAVSVLTLASTALLTDAVPPASVGPAERTLPARLRESRDELRANAAPNTVVTISHLFGCASHTIPLVFVVGFAKAAGGFSLVQGSSILAVISLTSVVSRLLSPVAGNLWGGGRVIQATLPLQLAGIALFVLFQHQSIYFYYLAATVFGLGFGSEMVLFSLISRQLFAGRIGTPLGVQLLGSGIGMGGGAFLGGVLLAHGLGYVGLFWVALALGVPAELVAFGIRKGREPAGGERREDIVAGKEA